MRRVSFYLMYIILREGFLFNVIISCPFNARDVVNLKKIRSYLQYDNTNKATGRVTC